MADTIDIRVIIGTKNTPSGVRARTTTLVRYERLNDCKDLVNRINLIDAHKLLRYMLILPTFYASSSLIVDPLIDMERRRAFRPVRRSQGKGAQTGADEAAICLERRYPRGDAPTRAAEAFHYSLLYFHQHHRQVLQVAVLCPVKLLLSSIRMCMENINQ